MLLPHPGVEVGVTVSYSEQLPGSEKEHWLGKSERQNQVTAKSLCNPEIWAELSWDPASSQEVGGGDRRREGGGEGSTGWEEVTGGGREEEKVARGGRR
ncbi:hypothetical protein CRUP_030695 [Coryphaenoides rupestris]|nr:hypothetical protein CRUP_030695 [Coryphaenoides rupestris]